MKKKILYMISIALLTTGFAGCSDSDDSFDNNIYINSASKTTTILLKEGDTDQASFQVSMPKPEDSDIVFSIAADRGQSAVDTYNEAYYDKAVILPEGYYSISDSEVTIKAGNVASTNITVSFNKLTELDRQQRYVLPVSINSSHVGVLQSARTMYFVLRGAALINVAADLAKNNVYVEWKDNSDFTAMRKFTAEALINPRVFDRQLSTIMGIEGKFLIRIGDSGLPTNQLQVATEYGNHTDSKLAIPTNTWTHVAVTYDADALKINVYINGVNMYTGDASPNIGAVNWGVPHSDESNGQPRCFWIGYAYDNNRYLDGLISECRVWNKVLTSAEINSTNHFYYVDPASEGLIAYWKFDDGGGNTVKDHSAKGNDATASSDLKWTAVELPVE